MKKRAAALLCAALLALAGCAGGKPQPPPPEDLETVIWEAPGGTIAAWYVDDERADDYDYSDFDPRYFFVGKAGKGAAGRDIFAFLRMPLPREYPAGEIYSATLCLRMVSGDVPEQMRVGCAANAW